MGEAFVILRSVSVNEIDIVLLLCSPDGLCCPVRHCARAGLDFEEGAAPGLGMQETEDPFSVLGFVSGSFFCWSRVVVADD